MTSFLRLWQRFAVTTLTKGVLYQLSYISSKTIWCTGEDSNLRSSEERQIYSLLALTTHPPVQNLWGDAFVALS